MSSKAPRPRLLTRFLPVEGGLSGGVNIEVVPEARNREDALDGLRGGGEPQGGALLIQRFLGAHERREGGRVHERNTLHIKDYRLHALRAPFDGILDLRGRMEIHLAAHRDDRVSVGVLVYANFEVHHADAPLSTQNSQSPTCICLFGDRAYHTGFSGS